MSPGQILTFADRIRQNGFFWQSAQKAYFVSQPSQGQPELSQLQPFLFTD